MAAKYWTTTEIAVLRKLYPDGGSSEVRKVLKDRSVNSIHCQARVCKIRLSDIGLSNVNSRKAKGVELE